MKSFSKMLAIALFGTLLAGTPAMAQTANVDYDHAINFLKYKTYTLQKVHATDPAVEQAITIAVDRDLAARYLHPDDKGDIIVAVVEATQDKQEYTTFYGDLNGLGWQRAWGSGGFLDATATVQDIPTGTLVLDMWDRKTQKLIWRGALTEALTNSGEKNGQKMDKAVGQLIAQFPPKFKKS
jgi:Domain of unknown function (DUF4136)